MARPFQFKLEKVLTYRMQLEEQAKAALAAAQAEYDAQRVVVEDLTARYAAHMSNEAESHKSSNDMWLWRQYKQALEQDMEREKYTLSQLELKLHQRRQAAVDRAKEKKLLEKLKQTQAKKYHAEQSAREEKENDEMATLRYKPKNF